ncbi:hypothetical protein JCM19231_3650 [Vibrio ishigakensis]|uniref:Uncharacterized protein n=1 Tax=Vibrio ishigakensis TaxID=1481914 RepID=A0A0B8NH80_9VIBR|nr:hypothetical protein [Vibrio ishigakensis]GAM54130.1 hypothetical protein JCM19231_3650 [Vibrio ishigakensis]GAM66775.1 hypothetical protein JCM19236_3105 [Vibrio sp. JCM 19236]
MKSKIATGVQAVLAVSIFYLGYAIHSVTSKIDEVIEHYPVILTEMNQLASQLKIDDWLATTETFNNQLPKITEVADNAVVVIADTNKAIESINQKIPQIQQELTLYRETVIPQTQKELKAYREQVIPPLLVESKQYRVQTIPAVIKESEALRAEVPVVLASVDDILDKSHDLGKKASQGAVKGVILSPVDLLRDTGAGLKNQVVGPAEED